MNHKEKMRKFRRLYRGPAVLLLVMGLAAVLPVRSDAQVTFGNPKKDNDKNAPRNLTGQVVDKDGKGLPQAVVYLKDKRSLEVQTHISDDRGGYRFSGLDNNTDYEVHAEFKGASSAKRGVSSFDNRKEVYLTLEVAVP